MIDVLNELYEADDFLGSKVQCSNCHEYGHTKVRCKQLPAETEDADTGDYGHTDVGTDTWAGGAGDDVAVQDNGGW